MNLRSFFVLTVLLTAISIPVSASNNKYPLDVHVVSSDYSVSCKGDYTCYGLPKLHVTIDGKGYIIASEDAAMVTGIGQFLAYVLKNGDYPGRVVKNNQKDAAEYHRVIELEVAPGVTRRYTVIGEEAN